MSSMLDQGKASLFAFPIISSRSTIRWDYIAKPKHLPNTPKKMLVGPSQELSRDITRFDQKNKNYRGTISEAIIKGGKLNDPVIAKIAGKYAKSPAQIMIRWSLQHPPYLDTEIQ